MTPHNSVIDYSGAWAEYRRRRLFSILSVLCFLVVPALVGRIMGSNRVSEYAVGILILVLFVVLLVEAVRLAFWPCPRCGKAFRGTAPDRKSVV